MGEASAGAYACGCYHRLVRTTPFPNAWPAFVQRSHSQHLRLPSFLSGGVAKFRLRITAAQPKNYVLVFQANGAESGKSVCAAVDGCNLWRYSNSQMPIAVATCGPPEHF